MHCCLHKQAEGPVCDLVLPSAGPNTTQSAAASQARRRRLVRSSMTSWFALWMLVVALVGSQSSECSFPACIMQFGVRLMPDARRIGMSVMTPSQCRSSSTLNSNSSGKRLPSVAALMRCSSIKHAVVPAPAPAAVWGTLIASVCCWHVRSAA